MKRNTGSIFVHIITGLILLLAVSNTAMAEVKKDTLWRDAVITELDVDFGGTGFHARWRFHRCHCGDLRVEVEQVAPDGMLTGELLMINGQVLLSRGFEQQGVDIEPLIQAPSLMLQLAFAILNRSQPMGPHWVNEKQAWDFKEQKQNFELDTGLATGIFGAPWSVKGSGWKAGSGNRRFELSFDFTNPIPGKPDNADSITFSGDLDFRKQGFPYPESTSLDGWRLQWLSLNEREARTVKNGLTLKELREQTKTPSDP